MPGLSQQHCSDHQKAAMAAKMPIFRMYLAGFKLSAEVER
jgi:hypothetical protein